LELGSGFNPEVNGRENVYLNGTVLGLTKEEVDEHFDEIAAFADIGDFIEQPVKTYSSGMMMRLSFSVAIHLNPDILIIDEALSVGDIRFQNKCLRKINDIKDSGCSILFVSHSTVQVEALCDRVIWLDNNSIKAVGEPAQLVRAYVNFMVHGLDIPHAEEEKLASDEEAKIGLATAWQWHNVNKSHNTQKNGEAEIRRFRIRVAGEAGATQLICQPQLLQIETEIDFLTKVKQPLFGCGIFNSLNEPVIHFNTANTKYALGSFNHECRVIISIEFTLPALRPGEYLLSLGIDDGVPGASTVLSHVYDAWTFCVATSTNVDDQGGYIKITDIKMKHSLQKEKHE